MLPRVLHELSPAPGRIKGHPSDFQVDELPLYPADGAGTHTYFLLEKEGLSTAHAIHEIAAALNVRRRDVGYAGLKDARAVTRQWMSIEHVDPQRVQALALPHMRVLDVTRHSNKLRRGHLKANRFQIKVRDVDPARLADLTAGLDELERRGVPNYFGPQRFGGRGDSWRVGQSLVRGALEEALDRLLGGPLDSDPPRIRRARRLYEEGDFQGARSLWPGTFRDERRALAGLAQHPAAKRRAFRAVDRATQDLLISAYQSHLFNQVVAQRVGTGLDRLWDGDLAFLHASGAVFRVEQAAQEQARADAFEISATGPLFGYRMTEPTGPAGELETRLLAGEGLERDSFRRPGLRLKGARRPVRFRPGEPGIALGADTHGTYLELTFVLPRGCYATALLRELFATGDVAIPGAEESPG